MEVSSIKFKEFKIRAYHAKTLKRAQRLRRAEVQRARFGGLLEGPVSRRELFTEKIINFIDSAGKRMSIKQNCKICKTVRIEDCTGHVVPDDCLQRHNPERFEPNMSINSRSTVDNYEVRQYIDREKCHGNTQHCASVRCDRYIWEVEK